MSAMRFKLDKQTKKRLRIRKREIRAEQALLVNWACLTKQQRDSYKAVIAKGMREFPTPAEAKLRPHLEALGFSFQVPIYGFIPDFHLKLKKIVIEVDGSVHNKPEVQANDARKDQVFRQYGWRMLRFTNERALADTAQVVKEIKSYL